MVDNSNSISNSFVSVNLFLKVGTIILGRFEFNTVILEVEVLEVVVPSAVVSDGVVLLSEAVLMTVVLAEVVLKEVVLVVVISGEIVVKFVLDAYKVNASFLSVVLGLFSKVNDLNSVFLSVLFFPCKVSKKSVVSFA